MLKDLVERGVRIDVVEEGTGSEFRAFHALEARVINVEI